MIKVTNAEKVYGTGESAASALKGVSLALNYGDFIILLGAAESGKSTLLHVASGLERTDGCR